MPIVRLYVSNLHWDLTEDELREEFKKAGRPTIVNIIYERDTGEPRGFGFVTLDTMNKAMDCWREILQGNELRGRAMHIDYAIPKDQAGNVRKQKPIKIVKRIKSGEKRSSDQASDSTGGSEES